MKFDRLNVLAEECSKKTDFYFYILIDSNTNGVRFMCCNKRHPEFYSEVLLSLDEISELNEDIVVTERNFWSTRYDNHPKSAFKLFSELLEKTKKKLPPNPVERIQ